MFPSIDWTSTLPKAYLLSCFVYGKGAEKIKTQSYLKKVGVIYLGRRGGGAQFTRDLVEELQGSKIETCLIISTRLSADVVINEGHFLKILKIREFKNHAGLISRFFLSPYFGIKIGMNLRGQGIQYAIFPMVSPLDWHLERILQLMGIKSIRIIHDHQPHKGEKWPSKGRISKLSNTADLSLFLSNYVAQNLDFTDPTVVSFPKVKKLATICKKEQNTICVVGRKSGYKNVSILNEIISSAGSHKNLNWIIAGEIADGILFNDQGSIEVMKGWLSETELHQIISKSSILLLPYSDATQSGLIPIAMAYGTSVVATSVGGLPEQLQIYSRSVITSEISSTSIIESISKALNGDFDKINEKISYFKILDAINNEFNRSPYQRERAETRGFEPPKPFRG